MNGDREKAKMTEELLRRTYTPVSKDKSEEILIGITNFLERYTSGAIPEKMMLEEAIRIIHRTLDFQYLGIAVRDSDGMFRYKTVVGLAADAAKALYKIAYSESDLFNENDYPSTIISDITRFYMGESSPYRPGEEYTFSRPAMLGKKRMSPDDMIEGDFFNIFIKGERNEILGYIELGVTRNSKLPDRRSIIWIELISRILAIMLTNKA